MFWFFLIIGLIVFYVVKSGRPPIDPELLGDRCPLGISREEFFRRFESQIVPNHQYFQGARREGDSFYMYYIPPASGGRNGHQFLRLHGVVLEGEVAYQFSEVGGHRQDAQNKARLVQKLQELCDA